MRPPTDSAPLKWVGTTDGHLELLDQTLLPLRVEWIRCDDVASLVEAIRSLRVRGAPAIGIAAAYGVCLGLKTTGAADRATLRARFERSQCAISSQSSNGRQSVLGTREDAAGRDQCRPGVAR